MHFWQGNPLRIKNYGGLNWDQNCILLDESVMILRMQSSHFEFRITQTSVFLNFLIPVSGEI